MACGPLFMLQYLQHEETLQLTLNSGPEKLLEKKVPEVFQQLKNLSLLDPSRSSHYYTQFQEWSEIQKSMVEWNNLKPIIEVRVQRTSILNALAVMFLTLLISFLVAKSITKKFQKLLYEKSLSVRREAELDGLTQWQVTARNLVHELRGPLTPIKLVASALYEEADATQLDESQKEGLQLSLQKIQQMENMIQKFMTFAKLPETHLEPKFLSEVIQSFLMHYKGSFKENLELNCNEKLQPEPLLRLDESLLHNAFFALLQNATEALAENAKSKVHFQMLSRTRDTLELLVSNTETVIPKEIEARLFQIGSSSKLNRNQNFGIGLAMAKKIMLDHGGDLILWQNSNEKGVSFKFIFPVLEETASSINKIKWESHREKEFEAVMDKKG